MKDEFGKYNLTCSLCGEPIKKDEDYFEVNLMYHHYDTESAMLGYTKLENVKIMCKDCYKTKFLKLCTGE